MFKWCSRKEWGWGWGWGWGWSRFASTGLPALALALAVASPLAAQQGVVAGMVVAERTLQPIGGVQVAVEGTQQGAVTDVNGQFRITGLSGTTVSLAVRRIGYRPVDQTVQVGTTDVRITMAQQVVALDQVVVTGTAGETQRRAIGHSVPTINAADVAATQPIQNLQQLINGRVAGVAVVAGSGMLGTASRVRIRGASSLSLSNDPLIYVDGVRVDNAQNTGPINQAFGSSSISRWNDFSPDDIESIEIIKGPAAATLYGTEAANGVIQIITKRGAVGAPAWNLSLRTGMSSFYDYENRLYTNYGPLTGTTPAVIDSLNISQLERERGNQDIWRTGRSNDLNLSVGGGSPQFRYYAGFGAERSTGVDYANALDRYNGRVNLSLTPSEKWDLSTSLGYTTGRTDIPLEAGGGGATWTTYYANPRRLADTARGFYSGPPEAYTAGYEIFQDSRRFTGSVTFNHRPVDWFNHRIVAGTDALTEDNQEIAQRNEDLAVFFSGLGGNSGGYMIASTRGVRYNTMDYVANAIFAPLGPEYEFTSSLGAQYYARTTDLRSASGSNFPAPGLKSLQALAITAQGQDDRIENNTIGVFFQQQVAWRNRLFLTGAVRADDNSNFGENFDLVYYPKASLSWVLSEEPFFELPSVSTLRLRAAYGESGQQPAAFTALRTYVPGGAGSVTPGAIGNPDLGPETSSELELGFDLSVLDDRLGVDFTYYTGETREAILSRGVPPSSGFGGSQFFNAGRISRNGLEVLLRASPIQSENFGWDMTLGYSNNSNTIEDLGEGVDLVSLGTSEAHVVGLPVGAWYAKRVLAADFDPSLGTVGQATNVMCDDGEGGMEACGTAPRVFLGNTTPTNEGAFTTTFTFMQNFRLNALVDFKGGYKKLDGNARVRCHLFALCRENFYPAEYDPVYVAQFQGGTTYIDNLVQDASYTKLREVALTYYLPQSFAGRAGLTNGSVTIAGRNLLTWTSYEGLEPEASFISGARGAFGQWEQNVLPQLQEWVLTFNVGF